MTTFPENVSGDVLNQTAAHSSSGSVRLLELRNISHAYGDNTVLNGISFQVPPGKATAVLGPSGCGKSTLLHIAAGLLAPSSGDLFYDGASRLAEPGWISYMQQNDLLLPWKTITENAALPLIIRRDHDALERARGELENFGLADFGDHYPRQLSGGMRQRAAFMRACLLRSDFLLLDEPFSRLDFLTRNKIYGWFQQYCMEHRPGFVLVTHDPEEALLLADEIIILSASPARIIENISVSEPHPRKRRFLSRQSDLLEKLIAKTSTIQ